MRIILDTSSLAAVLDEKDAWHKKAVLIEQKLIALGHETLFLDCVVNEVINVLMRRLRERKRAGEFNGLLKRLQAYVPEENISWTYRSIEQNYSSILETIRKSRCTLNLHDALIVSVANEFEIKHIVSFDKDFDNVGMKRIKEAGDL
ncbi:MAG: type II toxin-antitoxin system VapC family toxin [Candidatus Dadabacteria bacterium]|nr:MAG: type II toxin-antitoxin system VapC family toxin [Candidatus Dadabacteria bacterium]